MTKSAQTLFWEGEFGTEYTQRNSIDYMDRTKFWNQILTLAPEAKSFCELGTNSGTNLKAINHIKPALSLTGVEANESAFQKMKETGFINAVHCPIQDFTPVQKFDLVFTCGVLIHINPDDLPSIYKKMYEWSDKYILINEYFNPVPTTISYRGNSERLFKRDFASEFLEANNNKPQLVDYGFLWKKVEPAWDNTTWWLFKK